MNKVLFLAALVAIFAFTTIVGSQPAKAGQMSWHIKSNYKYKVQIEFYSRSRKHAWPGGGKAYTLNDYATHDFPIACNTGEKICYGAWVTGTGSKYWGVGSGNKHGCQGCCATCGAGDTPKIVLNP